MVGRNEIHSGPITGSVVVAGSGNTIDAKLRGEILAYYSDLNQPYATKKDPKEWETILDAAGAPCASIWRIEEVIDHPQIKARGAIQELDTPYGRLRFAGSGFKLAHGGGRLDRMAPELGADTDAVLGELGFDAAEIAALRAREIV